MSEYNEDIALLNISRETCVRCLKPLSHLAKNETNISRPSDNLLYYEVEPHICFIERFLEYRATQTNKIRSKHDAAELFISMNRTCDVLCERVTNCFRRWWLTTAMQYGHIALVKLMLADKKNLLLEREVHCHFIKPLYIAIDQGDLSLVKIFLRAGALVTVSPWDLPASLDFSHDDADIRDIMHDEHFHEQVSALEYACIVNQPEVVKLLVAYHSRRYPRPSSDNKHSRWTARCEEAPRTDWRSYPLHCIVKLATKVGGATLHRLPNFVQLIVDEGGSVHDTDDHGLTPLQCLTENVGYMIPLEGVFATESHQAILSMIKILLKAGSNVIDACDITRDPLRLLLQDFSNYPVMIYENFGYWTYLDAMRAIRNHVDLVKDITAELLANGADITRFKFYDLIPHMASNVLNDRRISIEPGGEQACDEIMDSLGGLFRCALLAGANVITDGDWSEFLDKEYDNKENNFFDSFVEIVEFSCRPGRSQKLINMIANALSPKHVKRLMTMLLSQSQQDRRDLIRRERMFLATAAHQYTFKQVVPAIQLVASIDVPCSLMYTACRAIVRTMTTRSLLLCEEKDVQLPLPAELKRYVLHL